MKSRVFHPLIPEPTLFKREKIARSSRGLTITTIFCLNIRAFDGGNLHYIGLVEELLALLSAEESVKPFIPQPASTILNKTTTKFFFIETSFFYVYKSYLFFIRFDISFAANSN